jgi:hypothetical protein
VGVGAAAFGAAAFGAAALGFAMMLLFECAGLVPITSGIAKGAAPPDGSGC